MQIHSINHRMTQAVDKNGEWRLHAYILLYHIRDALLPIQF